MSVLARTVKFGVSTGATFIGHGAKYGAAGEGRKYALWGVIDAHALERDDCCHSVQAALFPCHEHEIVYSEPHSILCSASVPVPSRHFC